MLFKKIKLVMLRRFILRNSRLHSLAWYICRKLRRSVSPLTDGHDAENLLSLNNDGFVCLENVISDSDIDAILEKITALRCHDRYESFMGNKVIWLNASQAPSSSRTIDYFTSDLIQVPEIFQLANNPRIINLVQAYLGVKCILSNVSCWVSQPAGESAPKQSQFFHRDKDGIRWLKLFVYLTDVDDEAGPHCYMKGSHKGEGFLKKLRFQDDEVFSVYPRNLMKVFKGKKGSVFLEDTFGVHKGLVPKRKKRIVLQFQYSIFPICELNYADKKPGIEKGYDSYLNQCFFQ